MKVQFPLVRVPKFLVKKKKFKTHHYGTQFKINHPVKTQSYWEKPLEILDYLRKLQTFFLFWGSDLHMSK